MSGFQLGHTVTDLDTWLHPVGILRCPPLRPGRHSRFPRARSERQLSRSHLLTFLFTDIQGSTRLWEADPATMMLALELHNRILTQAIEQRGGRVFSRAGDGMCAVFASPTLAVEAAVSAQRALNLPVRMGVATGEAVHRRNDYFGTVLNRAARVMAAGHGGQILLDGATTALLDGADVVSLGPHRLRDITEPIALFQVRAPGLRADFPDLVTADPTPGNLRPPADSFVGRQKELAAVRTALDGHRLVTLTGVGGVGKTRLAHEVAALVAAEAADEVWLIELASIDDPAELPGVVAATMALRPVRDPQEPAGAQSVAAALAARRALLVLDNCEHVLDAAADFAEAVLVRAPGIRILATSRERLAVTGEQLWHVDPLDTGCGSTAHALFVDRAYAVAPEISLADGDACASVDEICRRVDGIPLALEMAASRLVSMTLTELRDRLDDPLQLLAGPRRTSERHRTLRGAVQWSYGTLDEPEKSLFAWCSVFAGGFDLADISAVCGVQDEFGIVELLDALVRKSLLRVDRSGPTTRYRMLATIRRFAEEQLTDRCDALATAQS